MIICPFCNIEAELTRSASQSGITPQVGGLYLCGNCGGISTITLLANEPMTHAEFLALDARTKADLTFAVKDILARAKMNTKKIHLPEWVTTLK